MSELPPCECKGCLGLVPDTYLASCSECREDISYCDTHRAESDPAKPRCIPETGKPARELKWAHTRCLKSMGVTAADMGHLGVSP